MSATGRTDAESGFTLLEMLVVLAVTALIAALGYPAVERGIAAAQFRSSVQSAQALVLGARAQALAGESTVAFSPLRADLPEVTWTLPRGGLAFFADGSSTGGEVLLESGRRRARIAIDPATGGVRTLR